MEMHKQLGSRRWTTRIVFIVLVVGGSALAFADTPASRGDAGGATADKQSNAQRDLDMTSSLRRAVMADRTLSMSAHNVKIITVSGIITLKGPVKSVDEKSNIQDKAVKLVGLSNVKNEIEVAP